MRVVRYRTYSIARTYAPAPGLDSATSTNSSNTVTVPEFRSFHTSYSSHTAASLYIVVVCYNHCHVLNVLNIPWNSLYLDFLHHRPRNASNYTLHINPAKLPQLCFHELYKPIVSSTAPPDLALSPSPLASAELSVAQLPVTTFSPGLFSNPVLAPPVACPFMPSATPRLAVAWSRTCLALHIVRPDTLQVIQVRLVHTTRGVLSRKNRALELLNRWIQSTHARDQVLQRLKDD